ncbi:MAG TPA: O-antigen ligase family protein [Solirubrobacteraceae bacterium]
MRRAALAIGTATLLAGPTALAFFSGGYFAVPRLVAAIVAWLLVLGAVLLAPDPLPRGRAAWVAIGGLTLMTLWTAASVAWAPLRGPALEDVERLVLYLGALLAAFAILRHPRALRMAEPALAGGTLVVIAYGLAGRLLPGLVTLSASTKAGGRLEQPLTYWNAEGLLAAIGVVLCARIAGDPGRPRGLRIAAAGAVAPLAAGVYLSFSRGAIAAAFAGLLVLVAQAPGWAQLRAVALAAVTGVLGAVAAAPFGGVASLSGSLTSREHAGAVVLVLELALVAAAALVTARLLALERRGRLGDDPVPGARRLPALAAVVVGLGAVALVAGGLGEKGAHRAAQTGAHASRLTSVDSNRYDYWRAGVKAFAAHPLDGLGASGFRTYWLRHRTIKEGVQEVHSIELEMAAELGVLGLLALALFVGGLAAAGRTALRRAPPLAVGACAVGVTWLLHASIDWDWQMPAVTLPVLVLAGGLLALAEGPDAATPATRAAAPGADREPVRA